MTRLLITGVTGFIGRNLAEYFSGRYHVSAPASTELNLLDDAAVRQYLCSHRFDVVVHAATTRSSRSNPGPPDLLDRNCRMFFNLARNHGLFGKLIHYGSGAEYDRRCLPSRVTEEYFDMRLPADAYGFSKYIIAKYIERADNMVDLRLFGVFGKYEEYDVRFISNACCRVVKGLPILIGRNAVFDYLYVEDLANITAWFVEHDAGAKAYNAGSGRRYVLSELAAMVAQVSGQNPEIVVNDENYAPEYTGDNSRLLREMSGYDFRDMMSAIAELYQWYETHAANIDISRLRFDG